MKKILPLVLALCLLTSICMAGPLTHSFTVTCDGNARQLSGTLTADFDIANWIATGDCVAADPKSGPGAYSRVIAIPPVELNIGSIQYKSLPSKVISIFYADKDCTAATGVTNGAYVDMAGTSSQRWAGLGIAGQNGKLHYPNSKYLSLWYVHAGVGGYEACRISLSN